MADEEERRRLLEEGRRRFAKMKGKRAAAAADAPPVPVGVGIVAPPPISSTTAPLTLPIVINPVPQMSTSAFNPVPLSIAPPSSNPIPKPIVAAQPPAAVVLPVGPTTTTTMTTAVPLATAIAPPPSSLDHNSTQYASSSMDPSLATKLRMLEKANQVLLDQKAKLEDSIKSREVELSKVKIELEQERSSAAIRQQEIMDHMANISKDKLELEDKIATLQRSQQQNQHSGTEALRAAQEQLRQQQKSFDEAKAKGRNQIDLLQKQLQEALAQVAKAQHERDTVAQAESARHLETIAYLKQQVRTHEANLADKERIFEETLQQERLRAAQTVGTLNNRLEQLQKALAEAEAKLAQEKKHHHHNHSHAHPAKHEEPQQDAIAVQLLQTRLAEEEKRVKAIESQLHQKDQQIAIMAEELKAAKQQPKPAPPPAPAPAQAPVAVADVAAATKGESGKLLVLQQEVKLLKDRNDELYGLLNSMQANRQLLVQQLAASSGKINRYARRNGELVAAVQGLHSQLQSHGLPAGPLPDLSEIAPPTFELLSDNGAVPAPSSSSSTSSAATNELSTPTKQPRASTANDQGDSSSASDPETPVSTKTAPRIPPPTGGKQQREDSDSESGSEDDEEPNDKEPSSTQSGPQDTAGEKPPQQQQPARRGGWSLFGRIWGNGPNPPPKAKQNVQVVV